MLFIYLKFLMLVACWTWEKKMPFLIFKHLLYLFRKAEVWEVVTWEQLAGFRAGNAA